MTDPTEPHLYTTKEIERGYAINVKRVVMAYVVEIIIVIASLIGAWLFTVQYGHDDFNTMTMMMLAPIAYAVVEFCRVPMAIAVRIPQPFHTPPSFRAFSLKLIIVLGLIGAAFVTVKSISQLGEIMFRPRLFDVVHADERYTEAKRAVELVKTQIVDADSLVLQRTKELGTAEQQVSDANTNLTKNPGQVCKEIRGIGKNGKPYVSMRCVPDPTVVPLKQAVNTATHHRDEATVRLNEATAQRRAIDRVATENIARNEETHYREAVLLSQLHSFTAMVFGKKPSEVTDDQISMFLRLFVFIPSIGAAFSATIIALTAVTRIPPPPPSSPTHVEIPDEAEEFVLSSIVERILQKAVEDQIRAAKDASMPPPAPSKPNGAAEKTEPPKP